MEQAGIEIAANEAILLLSDGHPGRRVHVDNAMCIRPRGMDCAGVESQNPQNRNLKTQENRNLNTLFLQKALLHQSRNISTINKMKVARGRLD
jgi:hypothetical protein